MFVGVGRVSFYFVDWFLTLILQLTGPPMVPDPNRGQMRNIERKKNTKCSYRCSFHIEEGTAILRRAVVNSAKFVSNINLSKTTWAGTIGNSRSVFVIYRPGLVFLFVHKVLELFGYSWPENMRFRCRERWSWLLCTPVLSKTLGVRGNVHRTLCLVKGKALSYSKEPSHPVCPVER